MCVRDTQQRENDRFESGDTSTECTTILMLFLWSYKTDRWARVQHHKVQVYELLLFYLCGLLCFIDTLLYCLREGVGSYKTSIKYICKSDINSDIWSQVDGVASPVEYRVEAQQSAVWIPLNWRSGTQRTASRTVLRFQKFVHVMLVCVLQYLF